MADIMLSSPTAHSQKDTDQKQNFTHAWKYSGFLDFVNFRNKWDKPFRHDPIEVNFESKIFDGTWELSLFKPAHSSLRVRAAYLKVHDLISEDFWITLKVRHEGKQIWSQKQKTGEVRVCQEVKSFVSSKDSKGFLRFQRNVKMTISSYQLEWRVDDNLINDLVGREKRDPDVTFEYFIEGNTKNSL